MNFTGEGTVLGYTPELPVRFDGSFSMQLYWVSHGLLLLRSANREHSPRRIEILFLDVVWISLPAWFTGAEIAACELEPLLGHLPPSLRAEARFRRAFRLATEGVDHHIIAGSFSIAQGDEPYFANSALLPDLRVTL